MIKKGIIIHLDDDSINLILSFISTEPSKTWIWTFCNQKSHLKFNKNSNFALSFTKHIQTKIYKYVNHIWNAMISINMLQEYNALFHLLYSDFEKRVTYITIIDDTFEYKYIYLIEQYSEYMDDFRFESGIVTHFGITKPLSNIILDIKTKVNNNVFEYYDLTHFITNN